MKSLCAPRMPRREGELSTRFPRHARRQKPRRRVFIGGGMHAREISLRGGVGTSPGDRSAISIMYR